MRAPLCPDCWNYQDQQPGAKCKRPEAHRTGEADKIGVVIEQSDGGGKIHIVSDDFDFVDFEVRKDEPVAWVDPWGVKVPLPPTTTDIIITIRNVRKYYITPGKHTEQPSIDDGMVVEEEP